VIYFPGKKDAAILSVLRVKIPVIEATVAIPNRALFKPAEVCEIAQLQPYVLRSWEAEFPDLGIVRNPSSGRLYRRADVERVLQIKHLLFVEGLTLAGIRRRMEDAAAPVAEDVPINELLGRNARERLAAVKQGLRIILELLSGDRVGDVKPVFRLTTPAAVSSGRAARSNGKRAAVQKHRGVSSRRQKSAHRKRH
jgi:DNA-binding transcriptional MerR regulator